MQNSSVNAIKSIQIAEHRPQKTLM